MRVFLGLNDWLVFGFADRYIDDALSELVHVARARGASFAHAAIFGDIAKAVKQAGRTPPLQTESLPPSVIGDAVAAYPALESYPPAPRPEPLPPPKPPGERSMAPEEAAAVGEASAGRKAPRGISR